MTIYTWKFWGITCEQCKTATAVEISPELIKLAEDGDHVAVLRALSREDQIKITSFMFERHDGHECIPMLLAELPQ